MNPPAQTTVLRGPVRLIGRDRHPHAASRLQGELPMVDWIADPVPAPPGTPSLELRADPDRPEGSFSVRVAATPTGTAVEVVGGPFSGVIYGVEELLGRLGRRLADGVELPVGEWNQSPALSYRTLFTWDHSTHWSLDQVGAQEIGALNPYSKPPEGFLNDYRRLIDFMSRHRIAAVVVYGLLRDSHGGVEAAQEVCRYANERGVRILAGVGINAYGGVYFDGDHPYNLATWLRQRPDLAAQVKRPAGFAIADYGYLSFPRNDYMLAACPSQPDNLRWHQEALGWLVETVDVGGINFETGDYGTCECDRCGPRRDQPHSWSFEAMKALYPPLLESIATRYRAGRDPWHILEMYWDHILDTDSQRMLSTLPDAPIYQYCMNRSYWPRVQAELDRALVARLPHTRNVLRTHMGSQWNKERYTFIGRDVARMAQLTAGSGMEGILIWGEASAYNPPNEFNYLALSRFAWDAGLSWETFISQEIEPRLGGAEAAARYLALLDLVAGHLPTADLRRIRAEARSVASGLSADVERRWLWLEEWIARREYRETD